MINWSWLIARFISAVGSWIDASNLRNRVYKLEEECEILRIGLEDIQRMDPEGRMGWHAKKVIDLIDGRE